MGKLNIFEISFGNGSGVYYPGNAVDGHVTVELTEPMKMRGIRLKFEGKAYVHWSETHSTGSGKNRRTTTRHYSASERYFDQEVLLFGIWPNQGSETKEIPLGRHTFPFQFILPLGLPSSFEAGTGYVRYTVSCNIDKPWKFDHRTKRPFTIVALLDLNQQPNCMQRLQATKQKHLCCLCCKSGPIEATFKIERQGFVPGEAIKLFAEISNGSNRKMSKSYVDLKMITTFRATTKCRTDVREVARVTRPPIEKHREDSWSGEELVVPPLPPSFLPGCNIIDIRYVLQLNVDPSGPGLDLEVPFEIIIGSIPLMSVVEMYPPMSPPPQIMDRMYAWGTVPTAPATEDLYPYPPPSGIPNLPPPSYGECITGRYKISEEGDNEHTRGKLEYAPVYPYYNWGHTPGALPEGGAKS
ncbi:arrestin domain-containing protein 17-like [Physella acuta]|uniref:arrestin domain-containing protein 17-like n=1 Tax=Physella acuta TaxID=109671 RepID=UPI0027DD606A|nr:arrestin domain-containing protein 17-like [Physella acuta]XP_059165746.1 arrestin domain-containing protein 17-like [Physella acuta]